MAGPAVPAPLPQALSEHTSGDALDANAEAKARLAGWR